MLIRFSYDRVNVLLNSYHSHHYPCSCLLAIHLSCWRAAPTPNSTYPTVFLCTSEISWHAMQTKWRLQLTRICGSQIDMAAGWVIYSQIAKLQHDLQSLLVPHLHKKWASNSQELSNPLSLVPVWSANLWNSEGNGFPWMTGWSGHIGLEQLHEHIPGIALAVIDPSIPGDSLRLRDRSIRSTSLRPAAVPEERTGQLARKPGEHHCGSIP